MGKGKRAVRACLRASLVLAASFALLFGIARTPAHAAEYQTGISDANMRQLVLVVRFAGDTTGDGNDGLNAPYTYSTLYKTQWDRSLANFNKQDQKITDTQSVYTYVKTVSDGQLRVETVSPQTDGDTARVAYLTLPKGRSSYTHPDQLVQDAVAAFNKAYPSYSGRSLDMDGDGFVDNVLVVPEVGNEAPDPTSCLWARASSLGSAASLGASGKTASVGKYSIVSTAQLPYTGIVIHELLHTRGARDLYRGASSTSSGSGDAVGVWDIMARNAGTQLMWPLAITRQDCGWTTIKEVSAGQYTLFAPGSGKQQAVMFKSPLSQTEYFVAEYRKATVNPADLNSIDASSTSAHTIGGSGLIVYRVNITERIAGNGNKGDKDYVYLFRSGETGGPRGDGKGDIRNAQLSLATRSSLGSANQGASLQDGAITFSDGQNSGIQIKIVSESDASCTFSLSFADYDGWGVWDAVANTDGLVPFATVSTPVASLAVDERGVLYAALGNQSDRTCQVWTHDGSNWKKLGSAVSDSYGTPALSCYQGAVYLATQSANKLTVRRWGSSGWQTIGAVASQPYMVDTPLCVVGSTLMALAAPSSNSLQMYEVNGSGLAASGGSLAVSDPVNCILFDGGEVPAVAYGEGSKSRTNVSILNGKTWSTTMLSGFAASAISAASVKGNMYVYAYTYQSAWMYKVSASGGVLSSSKLDKLSGASMGASLVAGKQNLYLTGLEGADPRNARCYLVDPDSLTVTGELGSRVYMGGGAVRSAISNDKIYCVFPDLSDGSMAVRARALPGGDSAAEAVRGCAGQWRLSASRWWFEFSSGGYPASQWCLIDGDWYYFDAGGWMKTGWVSLEGTWYYLNSSGRMVTGWQKIASDWYYFAENGAMARGWLMLSDGTYYLNGSGQMMRSWQYLGASWFFFDSSGRATTGWRYLGASWYFFDGAGRATTGWQFIGESWFYMNSSGQVQTGWRYLGASWFFFDPVGHMLTSCWIDGLYWVGEGGHMAKNAWVDDGKYYVGADGKWVKGAKK